MELVIDPVGTVRCLYEENLDLRELGMVEIRRASYVEPGDDGWWRVDLSPVGGPVLGPFGCRSAGLAAEVVWLVEHRLARVW